MVNESVKKAIKESNIKQWMVAERYGLHEGNFSRLLRHELTEDEKERILSIIEELKAQRGA